MIATVRAIRPLRFFRKSAGGPFSWIVTNERPNLVKAVIAVEPNGREAHRPSLLLERAQQRAPDPSATGLRHHVHALDLGKVEEAYQEVAKRLGILPEAGVRDLKGPEAVQ